jgi:hypothetical protein
MADIIKACIDRLPAPRTRQDRMALVRDAKWQPGDAIVVSFLDGDPAVHERVQKYAKVWEPHMNLKLYFRQDSMADIRISFRSKGSWSYIGTECRRIAADQPTMNYGWLTPESSEDEVSRVVLHEFGHALGCIHEHQNPEADIKWNKEAVYEYYAGEPNYWTKEQVDSNVFETYSRDLTLYTKLDPQSIMMYPIDARFTEDGFSVGWNMALSQTDIDFIRQMYP